MNKGVLLACMLVLSLCPFTGRSQCHNVYLQTFGSAGNSTDTTMIPPIADSIQRGFNGTPLIYYDSNPFCPPPGTYALRYFSGRCDGTWLTDIDHTPGDSNGYMLIVNPQKQHDMLYRDTLKGTCSSYSYTFTVWVANLYKSSGTKPNLTLSISDVNTGNVLKSYSTGPINNGSLDGIHLNWVPVSMSFTIPAGYNSFIFEIDNNGPSAAHGNDFALDDISLQICKPANSISVNNQAVNSLTICPGNPVIFSSALSPDTLVQPSYQWQYSSDAITWMNIPAATGKTDTIASAAPANTGYYRQIAGAPWNVSDPDCWLLSNIIYLNVLPPPPFNLSSNSPLCTGDTLKLATDHNSYTYSWNGPAGFTSTSPAPMIPHVTAANAGNYLAQATDKNGCTNTNSVNVLVNPVPTVELGNDTTLCAGNTLLLNARNPGSTFLWNTGAAMQAITVNNGGQYWVTVNNGYCSATDSIRVGFISPPTVNLGSDTALCEGNTLTLNAGNPGATYLWNTGATTQTIPVSAAGTYWTQVSNAACEVRDSIAIAFDPPPVVHLGNDTTLCLGDTLLLNAGNPGAAYQWNTGATTQMIRVTAAGPYWVTVAKGACIASDTIRVSFDIPPAVNLGHDTTLCLGNTLTLNAGNTGTGFLWNTGATTQTIGVTSPGTYQVQVSKGACTARDSVRVTFDPPPVIGFSPQSVICQGVSLTLKAPNPGASYLWNDGSTQDSLVVNGQGKYWLTEKRGACTVSDTIQVVTAKQITVNLGADTTICNGNTLTLDAGNSGFSYLWNTGATTQTLNVTLAGTYWVRIGNGNCSAGDTIGVSTDNPPVVDLGNDTTLCRGNALALNAGNPGAAYLWNTGAISQAIFVNTPGTYGVAVSKGVCRVEDSVRISFDTPPAVDLGNDTTLCQGNTLTLNAGNPGATYLWNTGATSQTVPVSTAGTYLVKVNKGACTVLSDSIQVAFDPVPVVNPGNDTTLCQGNTLILNAGNPGATYLWNTGATSQTIAVDSTGQYQVKVNKGACTTLSDSVSVIFNTPPVVNPGNDTTLCQGNTLTLNAGNPGATYLWNTGATSQTIAVDSTGQYQVKVNKGACTTLSDSVRVAFDTIPVVNPGNDTTLCRGDTFILNAGNPGATYLWNTGATSQKIVVDSTGQYQVKVKKGACTTLSDSVSVIFDAPLVMNLGNDTTLCQGNTLTLDAGNPGATYLWSTGSSTQTISVGDPGNYKVLISRGACTANDSVLINFDSPPIINLGDDTSLCQGSTFVLDAGNPGSSYLWSTGANTEKLPVSAASDYWVKVQKGACAVSGNINIGFTPLPQVRFGTDTLLCQGSRLVLYATNPGSATYLWSNGATSDTLPVNTPGNYWVLVREGNCISRNAIDVSFDGPPLLTLPADTTVCAGDITFLVPEATNINAFSWQDGTTASAHPVDFPGTYTVTGYNACGMASASTTVNFVQCEGDLFMPNGFTPNGDGRNDVFRPRVSHTVYDFELYIFNRWGQLIFHSSDFRKGWDGTFKGVRCDMGSYVWYIRYRRTPQTELIFRKGGLTLIR